jgi:sugar phosphate isomerase/epimerase
MFSYQLYSSRNFPPMSKTFEMVSKAGYTAVEGYGALYADDAAVEATQKGLKATGLTMPTGHFGLGQLETEVDKVLGIAKALKMERLYCPYVMPHDRPTDAAGWKAFVERLQKAGAPYKAAGYGFGWHNHDFEFVKTDDGAFPQEEIFNGAPDIGWEADIAWIVRGGADPLDWIARHGNRITAVHVKDIAPAGENADEDGWADVGHGTVDWKAIWQALKATPATVFIMEHDKPKDHRRFASRSIQSAAKF